MYNTLIIGQAIGICCRGLHQRKVTANGERGWGGGKLARLPAQLLFFTAQASLLKEIP